MVQRSSYFENSCDSSDNAQFNCQYAGKLKGMPRKTPEFWAFYQCDALTKRQNDKKTKNRD